MKATDSGGSFEQAPTGTHIARCYKIIDLGTQLREFQGDAKKSRQFIMGWELPGELMTSGEYAGQPFTVSKFYTLSLHEKSNLRAHLKSWRGRDFTPEELQGFEVKNVLGKPCLVSVVMSEKGRAVVGGVMALPKGTQVPPAVNPSVYFSLDPEEFDKNVFDEFSDKMKALITPSDEYQSLIGNGPKPKAEPAHIGPDFVDDEIPF